MVGPFVLQWHITGRCNLRCRHCYQEETGPGELSLPDLLSVYGQFLELLDRLSVKGQISLTGGEPLCSPNFFPLLERFHADRERISFCVLTNGTLLTPETVERIRALEPGYVQVSLEGGPKMNDSIRGKGTAKRIAKGIRLLKKAGIFTSLSFTATSENFRDFPAAVRYGKRCGADRIWSDRYIPLGAAARREWVLDPEETAEYLSLMAREEERLRRSASRTRVTMRRALQFQKTGDFAYGCTAGDTLLTVLENGDLVPCRRMPVVLGSLMRESMESLYFGHPFLKRLRESPVPDGCENCEASETCRGGLRCLSYALYGDCGRRDPGCSWS